MSTSGQADPEMQSESRSREDCNPKRDVGMRDFSTALPIGTYNPERKPLYAVILLDFQVPTQYLNIFRPSAAWTSFDHRFNIFSVSRNS